MTGTDTASLMINELREFAGFAPAEQRYIKRSLDVGLARRDARPLWARDSHEAMSINAQYTVYRDLDALRQEMPKDDGITEAADYIGRLVRVTVFDLAQERLSTFSAFRFLYERLLGPEVRPFLPSAFCGAAALPQIRPEKRKHLLQSISEAAATAPGWSLKAPCFYPEWVEKESA